MSQAAGWIIMGVAVILAGALFVVRDTRRRSSGLAAPPVSVSWLKVGAMAVAKVRRSVAKARPVHCAMFAKELDTEIPAKPRRSISRASSRVAWRRPGVAIRFRAGRGEGIVVFHSFKDVG